MHFLSSFYYVNFSSSLQPLFIVIEYGRIEDLREMLAVEIFGNKPLERPLFEYEIVREPI